MNIAKHQAPLPGAKPRHPKATQNHALKPPKRSQPHRTHPGTHTPKYPPPRDWRRPPKLAKKIQRTKFLRRQKKMRVENATCDTKFNKQY